MSRDRRCSVLAGVCLMAALVLSPAAQARRAKAPPFTLVQAKITLGAVGHLTAQASNNCDAHPCADGEEFLSGSDNVNFSSDVEWPFIPLQLSGSPLPGIPNAEGYQSNPDHVGGGWSASGQIYKGGSFSCSGSLTEGTAASSQSLFDQPQSNGDHILKLTVAGAPDAQGNPQCDFPGSSGELMGAYYWNDFTKATGPFSATVRVTKAELGLPEVVKTIVPNHDQLPSSDCTSWVVSDQCTGSFGWSATLKIEPGCERISTGPGYDGLSAEMQGDLQTLYTKLKQENGCWHFLIGYRSTDYQRDLYTRWHQIADHQQNNPDVCKDEKAAGFGQCPEGWNPDGTAKGGPATPGRSRHESGQAADVTVFFRPEMKPNLAKYRSAAKAADLCGPPASDPAHVELKYKKKGQKTATCHFG